MADAIVRHGEQSVAARNRRAPSARRLSHATQISPLN
jgi:hypothetical protein